MRTGEGTGAWKFYVDEMERCANSDYLVDLVFKRDKGKRRSRGIESASRAIFLISLALVICHPFSCGLETQLENVALVQPFNCEVRSQMR